jgi:transposase
MRPLSQDLRSRIVAAREDGVGTGEVSQRFAVSRSAVERIWNQHRKLGHVEPKQIGGYRKSRLMKHGRTLGRWIEKKSDITLAELRERCLQELGVGVGINALWHQLRRMGLSSKKNDARRRARPT